MTIAPRLTVNLMAQRAEVDREIALRKIVYPRMVAAGKMTQAQANDRLETMLAIAFTLRELSTS